MSVAQLERMVAKEVAPTVVKAPFVSLFNPVGTDLDRHTIRFSTTKIIMGELGKKELQDLLGELDLLREVAGSFVSRVGVND